MCHSCIALHGVPANDPEWYPLPIGHLTLTVCHCAWIPDKMTGSTVSQYGADWMGYRYHGVNSDEV